VQSRISNKHEVVARLYKIFHRTRIRHFAISLAHLLRRGVLTFECSTQARFLQTHLARVVHTDALYFKRWTRRYRRDAVYGFSGDLPRSCCTRSPKKTAPRTAPKYKGSRKKRRDDERGPDRMASCNSKLFQWNGIDGGFVGRAAPDPSFSCSASRTSEKKRERERERERERGRGKEVRKATLLHRLLDWFSLCSKILTTSLTSVDCIFTASNKGSGL